MKFTDGYWSLRKGVKALYPVQVAEIEASRDTLTVHAPTKPIAHRGDTLNGTLLALDYSSPMPDVIRVRLTHHLGQKTKSPDFILQAQPPAPVEVTWRNQSAGLTSGRLSVRIARTGDWRVEFLGDGRTLTASGRKGMGLFETPDSARYLREQLDLGNRGVRVRIGRTVHRIC